MTKTNTTLAWLVLPVFGLILPKFTYAQDQEWCLSCHQYPGLVRQNQAGKLKVLHIDEQKYLSSKHGKFHCTACHQQIDKIPHVGKNKTQCQSQCHQSRKDQALLAKTPRPGFHRQQQSLIQKLEDGTSCKVCHAIYPHKKEPFIRTFLNMHTGYLVCEVCHLKTNKQIKPVYQWLDAQQVVFQGTPFGSTYDPTHKLTHKPDNILSRIAPFMASKGHGTRPLMNTQDTVEAIQFHKQRNQLSQKVQKRKLRYFHRNIVKMAGTKACEACHVTKGLLNFQQLGFSKNRAEALKTMPIGNIIKKYDVFYVPKLGAM